MLNNQVLTISLANCMGSVNGLVLTPSEQAKTAVLMLMEICGIPLPQCYPKTQDQFHVYSLELLFTNVKMCIQSNLGYWIQDRSAHVIPISYHNDVLTVHVYDSYELNPVRDLLRKQSITDLELCVTYLEKASTTPVFNTIATTRVEGLLDYRTLLYGA